MRRIATAGIFLLAVGSISALVGCAKPSAPDLLLVAPFHRGLVLAEDDPDTIRFDLRGAVGSLRMLPRNLEDPDEMRAAVAENPPAILWLRGTPRFDHWLGSLPESWHGVVLRTLPPARLENWTSPDPPGHLTVLYAPPARSDRIHAAYVRRLLHALKEGVDLREANRRAAGDEIAWTLFGDGTWTWRNHASKR